MVTTSSHQCNARNSEIDEGTVLFRNDANNVTELQKARRQKKLAEEVARLQQEELKAVIEDKEKIKAYLDRLNLEVIAIKEDFESKSKRLKEEIEEIEKAKREREAELTTYVNSQGSQLASLGNKEQDLRQRLKNLTSNIARMVKLAPESRQDNCLPLQYHKAIVVIMNIGNETVIDASKGR
ncbi:hypothetical protein FMEXI_8925 [Fusarium mexicanum]|uniref:Uncharacterized protein n=1 Tax=Fusarium mexicanum TaxID=751941 RepID=A0A8H5MR87_9HYPO|nr:hypothetical protein FMEXI_8925 [Fusarium mexicanum]